MKYHQMNKYSQPLMSVEAKEKALRIYLMKFIVGNFLNLEREKDFKAQETQGVSTGFNSKHILQGIVKLLKELRKSTPVEEEDSQ